MVSIYQKIRKNLDSLYCKNKSILIALSGGRDSMALLHILFELKEEYNLNLSVAYVNHNLRGTESIIEEKFVTGYIKKINGRILPVRS